MSRSLARSRFVRKPVEKPQPGRLRGRLGYRGRGNAHGNNFAWSCEEIGPFEVVRLTADDDD